MTLHELQYIRLFIDIILCVGLAVITHRFFKLRDVVVLSFRGALTILLLLCRFKTMENPEKYLARLARISEDDAKLAIAQGKLVDMLSDEAGHIINTMMSSVKGSREMVASIEAAFEDKEK